MADPAPRTDWLRRLRESLGGNAAPRDVIVPTEDGVAHVAISGDDIDALLQRQRQALSTQRRRYAVVSVMLAVTLVGFLGRSLYLETENAELGDRIATLEASGGRMDAAVAKVFATASDVSQGQVVPDPERPLAGLERVESLMTDTASAFGLYVEFTRRAVDHYTRSLEEEFAEIDTDPLKAVELAMDGNTSWGGGLSSTDGVGALLNVYVPDDLPGSLEAVAHSEQFRDYLPDLNPMRGGRMTSAFGMRKHPITGQHVAHQGIDLVSWEDPRIRAAGTGTVVFAGEDGLSGKRVDIDHGMGITTVYTHLSEINVEQGDWLERGDWLGVMGNTGRSDGAHLHYEVHVDDRPLDPLAVFRVARNVQ